MSVNRAIILGRVGRDVELRHTAAGIAVANVSVATSRTWKTKEGEKGEETQWHQVALYDRLAEIAAEFLAKGSQVYIEGRLKSRTYQDRDGVERSVTEIIAEALQLLGGRPDGAGHSEVGGQQRGGAAPQRSSGNAAARSHSAPAGRPAQGAERGNGQAQTQGGRSTARREVPAGAFDDPDDIPFLRRASDPLSAQLDSVRSGAAKRSRQAR
jgi:single-strand DNA-binding protein